jgi:hypothetical protein
MLVLAHAGQWLPSLLILTPTVGLIVWLVLVTKHDRRRERQKQAKRYRRPRGRGRGWQRSHT